MGASEPEGNPDLSIVIITLNEEQRLQNCLDSLPSGVELIVLDSGSSDGTCAIAEAAGARVYHREFTGYASQKNAACAHARRGWIFTVDADEVLGFARQRLAAYKVPKSAEFAAELPKNATGKVLKTVLREPWWEGRTRNIN